MMPLLSDADVKAYLTGPTSANATPTSKLRSRTVVTADLDTDGPGEGVYMTIATDGQEFHAKVGEVVVFHAFWDEGLPTVELTTVPAWIWAMVAQ